jgi:hypothetical protein
MHFHPVIHSGGPHGPRSIQPLRQSRPQGSRPHRRRPAHPGGLQDEAQGRLRVPRHRRPLRRRVFHRHQRRGLHHRRLHQGCGRAGLSHRRSQRGHAHRLPAGPVRPQRHRRPLHAGVLPDPDHRQQPGHGRRGTRQDDRLPRARARHPDVRRPLQGHLRPVAHPGPPGAGRRLHLRHHHQAQAGPAPRTLRRRRPTSSGSAATSSRTTNPRATRCSPPSRRPCRWCTTP